MFPLQIIVNYHCTKKVWEISYHKEYLFCRESLQTTLEGFGAMDFNCIINTLILVYICSAKWVQWGKTLSGEVYHYQKILRISQYFRLHRESHTSC